MMKKNRVASSVRAFCLSLDLIRSQKRIAVKARIQKMEIYVMRTCGHMCVRMKIALTSARNDYILNIE
jgi:hypothetical protein